MIMISALTKKERALWHTIQRSIKEGSPSDSIIEDALAVGTTLGIPKERIEELVMEALNYFEQIMKLVRQKTQQATWD
jgi:hypothetical protein